MAPTNSNPSPRSPHLAALFGWLFPGAGHLYVGRLPLAGIGLVVIGGMYLLGVQLSNGMFLEYLPPEMRGNFSHFLSPEFGNFGFLYWHKGEYGFGLRQPREWPSTIHLGTTLTACSGILNLLFAAHANLLARSANLPEGTTQPRPGPATAAAWTWFVPGAGQFLQGRRVRGVVIFVALVGLFALGTWLAGGTNLDRERHFYYWGGQAFLGAPAFVTEFLHGHPLLREPVAYADGGVVMASIAGLLNILAVMDAYAFGDEQLFPEAYAKPEEKPA